MVNVQRILIDGFDGMYCCDRNFSMDLCLNVILIFVPSFFSAWFILLLVFFLLFHECFVPSCSSECIYRNM